MKIFQLLIGSFIIFIIGCNTVRSTTSPNQVSFSSAINKAEIAITERNISEVEKLLQKNLITNSINQQIDSLLINSKYQFALGNYRKAKDMTKLIYKLAVKQANPLLLMKTLSWQGRLYIEWQDVRNAKEVLLEADEIADQFQLTYTTAYYQLQYYWGLLQITDKNYVVADSTLNKLLDIPNLKKQADYLFYQVKYRLGEAKKGQELFSEADSILTHTLLMVNKEKGGNYFLNVPILNILGRLYVETRKFEEATTAYSKAIELASKKQMDINHPSYCNLVINFGQLFIRSGNYKKAEELILKSEPTIHRVFGDTYRYALILANLDILYSHLGDKEKAIAYTLKQKSIYQNSERYAEYARVLNNLSYNYQKMKKYEDAEKLFKEGIEILEEHHQTQTSLYAKLLINYATLNLELEKFEKSQKLFEKARKLLVKTYGIQHPHYASVINNLAYLYKKTENYKKAKNYYLETERIDSATVGIRHPYYIGTTYGLASIHELTKETDFAHHYFQRANKGQINLIYNYYSGFDEATRLYYLAETGPDFHDFFSFAWRHHQAIPNLTVETQNLNLAIKNLALDFSAQRQVQASEIQDSNLLKTYQDWTATKKQLSQSYIQSPEEQKQSGVDINELENKAELLEKELVRNDVLSMGNLANQHRTTFEEVKNKLKDNEATIDFLRFPYYLPERQTDSVFYCALVSRNALEQPQFVFLGEEKQLKQLLSANVRQNGFNYIEDEQIRQDLYRQIWQPLAPHLEGIEEIAISSSGLLHKVAFGALQDSNNQPLIDKHNFTYYDNLRYINKTVAPNFDTDQSITLIGAANFDLDSVQMVKLAEQRQNTVAENTIELPVLEEYLDEEEAVATRSSVVFNYLPATKKEVQDIAEQFQSKNWQVNTYTDLNAVEEQFKLLEGRQAPSILHIATHGYFFEPLKEGRKVPNNARGRIMAAKNPLLRSGLALSGANYAWKWGKNIPNLEDGILTAYEIANQNLNNTELVVLSACETGLGDVVSGEGVFGLQRAFKMAGVDNMLISLWKVPDQQTQELMTAFYQFYLQSNDASKALHQAQLRLSKKYRPFYWGGFIVAK